MPRGWALLLCAYLLVWIPANFASELLSTVPSVGRRGPIAVVELLCHGLSAATCAVAGWMLLVRTPVALLVSTVAVVLSCVLSIQSLSWTVLPQQVAPGERLPLAVLTCAHGMFWLLVIRHYARRPTDE